MDKEVTKDEKLYRMVKRSQPSSMTADGFPTSALFKQENGVSVDRDGGRDESSIISTFQHRFGPRFKGLVKVCAETCFDNEIAVIPEPNEDNKFHAGLYDNLEKAQLSNLKMLILADHAEVVLFDKDVAWT